MSETQNDLGVSIKKCTEFIASVHAETQLLLTDIWSAREASPPLVPSISWALTRTVATRCPALRTLPSRTNLTPSSRATCCSWTACPCR